MTSPGAPDQAPAARGAAPGRVKTKGLQRPLQSLQAPPTCGRGARPPPTSSDARSAQDARGTPHEGPRTAHHATNAAVLCGALWLRTCEHQSQAKTEQAGCARRVPDSLRFEVREVAGGTPGVCREVRSRTDTGLVLLLGARCGAGARGAAAAAVRAGGVCARCRRPQGGGVLRACARACCAAAMREAARVCVLCVWGGGRVQSSS